MDDNIESTTMSSFLESNPIEKIINNQEGDFTESEIELAEEVLKLTNKIKKSLESVTFNMNALTLSELKLLIEQAIAKHGGDKRIKLFDCDGKEVYAGKVVEFHSDRGVWLEIK